MKLPKKLHHEEGLQQETEIIKITTLNKYNCSFDSYPFMKVQKEKMKDWVSCAFYLTYVTLLVCLVL